MPTATSSFSARWMSSRSSRSSFSSRASCLSRVLCMGTVNRVPGDLRVVIPAPLWPPPAPQGDGVFPPLCFSTGEG